MSLLCPLCREEGKIHLKAKALDVYQGLEVSYARCFRCGILYLLEDTEKESSKDVDYSASGYYQMGNPHLSTIIKKITSIYALIRTRMVRRSGFDFRGKTVLDIGCGKGLFLKRAQEEGAIVSGVEPTKRSFHYAQASLGNAITNGIMEKGLYPSEHFELITMWHVFEHIPDPVNMLTVCKEILKPGGLLVIAIPNYSGFLAKVGGATWFNLDPPRHLIHYNSESIAKLLHQKGFKVFTVNHHYPELTFLGGLQTVLNKLPITPNFLFNFLKRNRKGLPSDKLIYCKDFTLTGIGILTVGPLIVLGIPMLSMMKLSDCITVLARKV